MASKKGLGILGVVAGLGAVVFGVCKLLNKGNDDETLTPEEAGWTKDEAEEADSEA